jgi:hypothetical protein
MIHQVDLVTNYVDNENYYLLVSASMIKKMRQNDMLLRLFCKGLFNGIGSGEYSFTKNKAVLTLHRSFALALYATYHANIKEISVSSLSDILSGSEKEIIKYCKENVVRILRCLMDFAESYGKQNYFKNYLPFYLQTNRPFI